MPSPTVRSLEEHVRSWLPVVRPAPAAAERLTPAGRPLHPPRLRLMLPARAESLGVVRGALRELCCELGVEEALVADISLAVTEACTNVVLHAYPEGEHGPLEVLVWTSPALAAAARAVADDPPDPRRDRLEGERRAARPRDSRPGDGAEELVVLVRDNGRGLTGARSAAHARESLARAAGAGTAAHAEGPPTARQELNGEEAPRDEAEERVGLGIGLQLIAALAKTLSLGRDEAGHTEVLMGFDLGRRGGGERW